MGRYREAARRAAELTNKELGTRIAALSPVNTERLQGLLPAKRDKEGPYRPPTSVAWRALVADVSSDSSWSWRRRGGELQLAVDSAGGLPEIVLTSSLPNLLPRTFWQIVLFLVLLGVVVAVVWLVVRFTALEVFLLEVNDPIPAAGPAGGAQLDANLILVCRDRQEEIRLANALCANASSVDFGVEPVRSSRDRWRIISRIGPARRVVLQNLLHRAAAPGVLDARLALVQALTRRNTCTVVALLTQRRGAPLGMPTGWLREPGPGTLDRPSPRELLDTFIILGPERWPETAEDRAAGANFTPLMRKEAGNDKRLMAIWQDLTDQGATLTDAECLVLLGERALPYYAGLWTTCTTAERVVLVNVAENGLANAKDHHVLRRLLARGLLAKTPAIELKNETFRSYVLRHRHDLRSDGPPVARSVWDSVRWPLIAVLTSAAVVLLVTQREAFTAANAVVVGLSTGLPAFARVVGLLGGRRLDPTGAG